jgi:hypothetical protein
MEEQKDIGKLDHAMAFETKNMDGMDWYTVDDAGFELDGLYWRKPGELFRRLPMEVKISEGVDYLAWDTAGVMLRFCTDAPEIRIAAKIWHNSRMDHMAPTGSMGFDLYVGSGPRKYYAGSTRFDHTKDEYNVTLFGPCDKRKLREFTLHFPLYSGPESFRIGLTQGALVTPPSPWPDPRPVVVYGTSIQQGGCASRPGMCHTNQMSRMLNRPFLNLGFSGNGKGEPEMAQVMADIANPAIYVLDYDCNAHVEGLQATLTGFIDILRKKHPETPILLVSRLPLVGEFGDSPEYSEERRQYTEIHLDEIRRRRTAGDENLHFLDGLSLYGADPSECTVDGCHATDLGFYQISKRMAPVIERILANFPN